eukprot:567228_1
MPNLTELDVALDGVGLLRYAQWPSLTKLRITELVGCRSGWVHVEELLEQCFQLNHLWDLSLGGHEALSLSPEQFNSVFERVNMHSMRRLHINMPGWERWDIGESARQVMSRAVELSVNMEDREPSVDGLALSFSDGIGESSTFVHNLSTVQWTNLRVFRYGAGNRWKHVLEYGDITMEQYVDSFT